MLRVGWVCVVSLVTLSGCLIPDRMVDAVLDADGDGERSHVVGGPDCDDSDPMVNTRMPEICFDGIDNNCDGFIDDVGIGAQWWFRDGDGDGYGDPDTSVYACYAPDGYVDNDLDCDDGMRNVHPGAEEVCDGIDNNCDGVIDDAEPVNWYRDADLDGWGVSSSEVEQCAKPPGTWVQQGGDCDDTNPHVNPGATEVWYDGVDQNCDGRDDFDRDGDGFRISAALFPELILDPTYSGGSDCNDADPGVNPDATEVWYDGVDQDCDGRDDFDQDGDGHRINATLFSHRILDPTYTGGDDCDDDDPARSPSAAEVWYDGVDQDCDGRDDFDQDGDGFRISAALFPELILDPTYVGGSDCDDTDGLTWPGAPEIWYDGKNQACNGADDFDRDGDGHRIDASLFAHLILDPSYSGGDDCDDNNSAVRPGMPEVWYDGVDQNCDGRDDFDQDGDGYRIDASLFAHLILDPTYSGGDDCDDLDLARNPSAAEVWYDGVDQSCDGADDFDQDGDGHRIDASLFAHLILDPTYTGGDDCDDLDAHIHPSREEVWYNGVDENCDGADDYDQDGDGYRATVEQLPGLPPLGYFGDDCDDLDPAINPGAEEICGNGIRESCGEAWKTCSAYRPVTVDAVMSQGVPLADSGFGINLDPGFLHLVSSVTLVRESASISRLLLHGVEIEGLVSRSRYDVLSVSGAVGPWTALQALPARFSFEHGYSDHNRPTVCGVGFIGGAGGVSLMRYHQRSWPDDDELRFYSTSTLLVGSGVLGESSNVDAQVGSGDLVSGWHVDFGVSLESSHACGRANDGTRLLITDNAWATSRARLPAGKRGALFVYDIDSEGLIQEYNIDHAPYPESSFEGALFVASSSRPLVHVPRGLGVTDRLFGVRATGESMFRYFHVDEFVPAVDVDLDTEEVAFRSTHSVEVVPRAQGHAPALSASHVGRYVGWSNLTIGVSDVLHEGNADWIFERSGASMAWLMGTSDEESAALVGDRIGEFDSEWQVVIQAFPDLSQPRDLTLEEPETILTVDNGIVQVFPVDVDEDGIDDLVYILSNEDGAWVAVSRGQSF